MTFDALEIEAIAAFDADLTGQDGWDESPLRRVLTAAPTAKGSFGRDLIGKLAAAAGLSVAKVPGRQGSRLRLGRAVCELKFSMEDSPRFQQVRPPDGAYDCLIAIGARPDGFVYWFLTADEVTALMASEDIAFQHADSSRWFFPALTGQDAFSPFRCDTAALIARLQALR